ncbi:YT521-B-like domain-containing protein [Aspergillus similis]
MDGGTPQNRPTVAREAKGGNKALSEPGGSTDPSGAYRQQTKVASSRQASQFDNVQHFARAPNYLTPTGNYAHPQSVFGMGNMASALSSYPSGLIQYDQQSIQQQFVPVCPNPATMYGMPQFQSFPAPAPNPSMMFHAPYPQMYMPYVQQQQQHPDTTTSVVNNPNSGSPQNPMGAYGHGYFHPNVYATQVHHSRYANALRPSSQLHNQSDPNTRKANDRRAKEDKKRITIVDGSGQTRSFVTQGPSAGKRTPRCKLSAVVGEEKEEKTETKLTVVVGSAAATSNLPKGPSRKPKQSGNALWVGNLAPGTNIVELKDHFSQDATKDLESVFLISRSNCAFVNYKTEEACIKALSRFHDTRLRGARLVCRVRRGLMSPGPHSELTGLADQSSIKEAEEMVKTTGTEDDGREGSYSMRVPNRYFILKSLTVEDLELSWQSGIWATQTHNEESLNRAFENADNVYLFFSANKSGEYYGYARMMSTIKDDESLTLELPPRPEHHSSNEPDSPDVTPTPASTSAPNGRIINDVARGTIFWEADTSEDEEGLSRPHKNACHPPDEQQNQGPAELQLIGKPFRIRWLSTEKVPFHRTRGLRNPWNANREVKIARDGTELEFSVGEKLVLLFHPESSG